MRGKMTLIAFSAAAALAVLGISSAALAGDSGENNQGGSLVPGSMAGVNPVYHPGLPRAGAIARTSYGYANTEHRRHPVADHRDR